jgi:hypothetical protein
MRSSHSFPIRGAMILATAIPSRKTITVGQYWGDSVYFGNEDFPGAGSIRQARRPATDRTGVPGNTWIVTERNSNPQTPPRFSTVTWTPSGCALTNGFSSVSESLSHTTSATLAGAASARGTLAKVDASGRPSLQVRRPILGAAGRRQ